MTKGTSVLLLTGPSADAMGVVGVVARTPGNHAGLALGDLVGLAFETTLIDTVFADGTILNGDIPTPKCNCIPLFNFDPLVNFHLSFWLFKFYNKPLE